MIKHILVPTDGSAFASVGVRYAAALAKHYGATVHGVHVVDIKLLEGPFLRDVSASLGTAPYVNYQGNIAMILEERGKVALETVKGTCRELEVACDTSIVTGLVPRSIITASDLCDIIVMGRAGEHDEWLDGIVGSTTESVVRRATRPVLVTACDTPGHDRFVVAYDGSSHAKSALQVAARTSSDWGATLSVLVVGEGQKAEDWAREARAYLAPHSLPVEHVARRGDPSEVIVEFAREVNADLLIMGSYGHTKVREMVVGSTTAYAMNHASCPLLLTR